MIHKNGYKALGVSREAVREAIRVLELTGLVLCVHGEGNFLADDLSKCFVEPMSIVFMLGCNDVRQVQQLRQVLEVKTAELASEKASRSEIDRLESICRRFEIETDEHTRSVLDRDLHYAIAEIAGNPLILSVYNAASILIKDLISDIRLRIINNSNSVETIDRQHFEIVQAISENDAVKAACSMDAHMKSVRELIEKYL